MHAQGILVALEQVYAASRLVQELRAGQQPAGAAGTQEPLRYGRSPASCARRRARAAS